MINPDVWIKRSKGGWTLAITEADVDVAREENVEGGGPEQSVGVGLD